MKVNEVVDALSALAQPSRLEVFRLLVRRGADGLPAGEIAERLKLPATTLSFHLAQLARTGLLTATRRGRSIVYAADYARMQELVGYLVENCCAEGSCGPIRIERKTHDGDEQGRARRRG